MLDKIVLYKLFVEEKLIQQYHIYRQFFFGSDANLNNELIKKLFRSNGILKLDSFISLEKIFELILPSSFKNQLKFSVKVKKIDLKKKLDFITFDFEKYLMIKNTSNNNLKFLFNEKILSLCFTIFFRILVLSKIDQVSDKIWINLNTLKFFIDESVLKYLSLILSEIKFILRKYREYIYYFVIES